MARNYDTFYSEPNLERSLSHESAALETSREPPRRNIEIVDIQTTVVGGNYNWVLIRIYTDAGFVGTGEAFIDRCAPDLALAMKPFLVGENPMDLDRLYEHLIQSNSGTGSLGGSVIAAISGIDMALHDIVGQVLETPAYQLLGGKYRDWVRMYCDSHAGDHLHTVDREEQDLYAPESYADAAAAVVDDGFDALKFDLDIPSEHETDSINRHLSARELQEKVDIVAAVMERVGDRADVAFDCHWTWSGETARRLAKKIEPYDVLWLEDPVPAENDDVTGAVTEATSTPIATGENLYRKHGHRQLIQEQAVDVLHPDMSKAGGMRETWKIATMADAYYLPVAIHNICSPIGTVAAAHLAASMPNFITLEYHARDVPWWGDLIEQTILEDGRIRVPERPGLGVSLDIDVVEEHMVQGETLFDEA